MPPWSRLLGLLLLAATLPACATITTGTTQAFSVSTEPAGAICTLNRDGSTVGVVNPTPGTVQLGRSTRELTVSCDRPGHARGITTVSAQFQPMTMGNILFGGLIGVAVDASSGAMSRYPDNVALSLVSTAPAGPPPEVLALLRATETRRSYNDRRDALRASCTRGADCARRTRTLESERDADLAILDAEARAARPTS